MTQTICQDQSVTWEDGLTWKLTLVATPGVGTWNIKATLSRRHSKTKQRHGRWSSRTGWNPTMWRPGPNSLIAEIAENWMRAHPVPISAGVEVSRRRP
jgi:hypothetical protein